MKQATPTQTANVAYYEYYDVNRTIEGETVYPNNYEHSKIRAYLNGLSYAVKATNSDEQTAFTNSAQSLIATTTVDISAASTNPASNEGQWNSGTNDYVDIMYGGVVPALCLSSLE